MPRDDESVPLSARVSGAMNRRLVDALAAAGRRRRFSLGSIAVYSLATAVHVVTACFLLAGLALLVTGEGWIARVLGGLCLLVVVAVAPKFVRTDRGADLSTAAPQLRELVDEIGAVVASPRPTSIHVSHHLEVHVSVGPLGGRALTIGAPLWVVCSPAARVAMIAHELGHLAGRDLLHGRYVAAAYSALVSWHDIFSPRNFRDQAAWDYGLPLSPGTIFIYALMSPVRATLRTYLRLMDLANGPAQRRRELYADLAAVRAAGTDGTVDLLETVLGADGIVVTANRTAVTTGRPSLRTALEEFMASYGVERRQEARRRGEAEHSRVDDSHPPTVARLRLVESIEHVQPAVVLEPARNSEIERELASTLDQGLASFADLFRG